MTFNYLFILFYMYVYSVCVYVCTLHACLSAQRGQKKVLDIFEMELKMAVGCHVGTGHSTLVLKKSIQCS